MNQNPPFFWLKEDKRVQSYFFFSNLCIPTFPMHVLPHMQSSNVLFKHIQKSTSRDGNGAGLGRGSYPSPPPPPRYPYPIPHPRPVPFSGELSSPRPRPTGYPWVPAPPQYEFSFFILLILFHSFWLNYTKQKNSISMKTIDLLAN